MTADTIKVPARELRKGDLLIPTNRVVEWCGDSLRCPPGKVEVHLKRIWATHAELEPTASFFNRGTLITVRRAVD